VIELDESGDYKLFFQFVPLDESGVADPARDVRGIVLLPQRSGCPRCST